MLLSRKAVLITTLVATSLACNLPARIGTSISTQVSNQIEAPSQSQAIGTPTPTLNVAIRTEIVAPAGASRSTTHYCSVDPRTGLNHVYVVLANTSTDPLDIVTGYKVTITWFDDSNQVIETYEQEGLGTNIFPQERQLLTSYVDPDTVNGRTLGLVRLEFTEVTTVKSAGGGGEWYDKISLQNWSHPFVTTNPGAFHVEPYLIDYLMGMSKVAVQNNTAASIRPKVVGLYFNESDELVAVGGSGPFDLVALGSAEVDVVTTNMSSVPVRTEYFVEMPSSMGVIEMMGLLYP